MITKLTSHAPRYNQLQKINDSIFCYMMAWIMILTAPVWLPFWLARRIYKDGQRLNNDN